MGTMSSHVSIHPPRTERVQELICDTKDPLRHLSHAWPERPAVRQFRLDAIRANFTEGLAALGVSSGWITLFRAGAEQFDARALMPANADQRFFCLLRSRGALVSITHSPYEVQVVDRLSALPLPEQAAFQLQTLLNLPFADRNELGINPPGGIALAVLYRKPGAFPDGQLTNGAIRSAFELSRQAREWYWGEGDGERCN